MTSRVCVRVRLETGWEIWDNVESVIRSYDQTIPFTWHHDEYGRVVIDEW